LTSPYFPLPGREGLKILIILFFHPFSQGRRGRGMSWFKPLPLWGRGWGEVIKKRAGKYNECLLSSENLLYKISNNPDSEPDSD